VASPLERRSDRFGTPAASVAATGIVTFGLAVLFDVERPAKLDGTFGISCLRR